MNSFRIKSLHIDTARSFIPIEELKSRINTLSSLGYTHLQLGLTDDQGWRFESLKYPKLHQLGSHRKRLQLTSKNSNSKDEEPYGGYYSQKELKDLVTFARNKNLELIPLINIPGHSSCAILAYPELGSGEEVTEVPSLKGRELFKSKSSTICYTKEFTFTWVKDIYTELMNVFDSEYIHLGFDEICVKECSSCNKCDIESLETLLDFTQKLILSRKRKPIIWWRIEKNFNFNLERFPDLILQWWGQTSITKNSTTLKNQIIFSQPQNLYFDYPGKVGNRVTSFDDMGTQLVQPHSLTDKFSKFPKNIIGVGACLWTENLVSEKLRSKYLDERLVDLSKILNGEILPKYKPAMGPWISSSYISHIVKLVRKLNLPESDLLRIEDKMNTESLGPLLQFLNQEFPQVDFRSIPLSKISNSIKGTLSRDESNTDIEIINKLYSL